MLNEKLKQVAKKILLGLKIIKINNQVSRSKLIKKGNQENLYKTKTGLLYWLNSEKYLDRTIIDFGEFEPDSTRIVQRLIKQGDTVLDVGANIGYYSILFSKIVGETGRVLSFEPTKYYRKLLEKNIEINNMKNINIYDFGLSDKNYKVDISIGESSATLHWVEANRPKLIENIKLVTLDEIIGDLEVKRIDFIKIDVDGHEPLFLKGAQRTIDKYSPLILLEVNHLNYIEAGFNAPEFYDSLKENNFYIYSEKTLKEYGNKTEFLKEAGNFSHSANIILSRKKLKAI